MKMSVCVDALWPSGGKKDFYEGIAAAAGAGAQAFEFWSWWNRDVDRIDRLRRETGTEVSAFCTRFVSLTDPEARETYLDGLRETIRTADRLGCGTIITQVGNELPGIPRAEQHRSIAEGLRSAAPMLEKSGETLVIEPLNTAVNHKGYYLWSSDEAAQIIDEVGSPNVKILFDIYHQQIMEGNIVSRVRQYVGKIGHMHCAGVPGRGTLENCELDYGWIFREIEKTGYAGYMALELFAEDPEAEVRRWCGMKDGPEAKA